MGWWSDTVMGGDTPLDKLGTIADAMGVKFSYDTPPPEAPAELHCYPFTRSAVEANLSAAVEALARNEGYEGNIGRQALGVVILWTGAEMPDDVRDLIIEAAEADEWAATGDDGRVRHMADFILAVQKHRPGTRTSVTSEGLFQALDKLTTETH